jgi:hypothetical protein
MYIKNRIQGMESVYYVVAAVGAGCNASLACPLWPSGHLEDSKECPLAQPCSCPPLVTEMMVAFSCLQICIH